MCGITGIFAFNQVGSFYMVNLAKAIDKLSQRGPDGRGVYIDDFVGLGHRRLSIIDTSYLGNQPMYDEAKRYVIVFNGEIFNYKELRSELDGAGVKFSSTSDTEVLLHLYIKEGPKCLDKLIGFFAFAIYDKEEKTLFVARDRIGVKPLHYYVDEDKFIFASELKSILAYNIPREINANALYSYLQLNYVPQPLTMFNNIQKLEPGHYLWIKKKEVIKKCYYRVESPKNLELDSGDNYEIQKKKLVELLEDSVQRRLIADVPVGAFLSGGIDSSVVVALASKFTNQLRTFSIGYADEPYFDETKYAELVAKKYQTKHTVFSLTNDDLLDHVYHVLDYLDEPFADSSALAVYILSKHTSKEVKVALSGDGADELFGGYNKHLGELRLREGGWVVDAVCALDFLWKALPKSRNGVFSNKIRQFHRLAEGRKLGVKERFWRWCGYANEVEALSMLHPDMQLKFSKELYGKMKNDYLSHFTSRNDLNEVFRSDMDLVLPNDMLVKVDMMSMANGLEIREPFLDHRLVDFAFTLPWSFKINKDIKKRIVQDAFREMLPAELYNRPKHGFEVPLLKWFRKELKGVIMDDLLADRFVEEQGIFEVQKIKQLKQQLFSKDPGDVHARIWGLIVFQYWWKKYMKA
jgi:asparagine synthase (glutamine-hydrolysing)